MQKPIRTGKPMNTYRQARAILRVCPNIDVRRAEQNIRTWANEDLLTAAWDEGNHGDREALADAGLAPSCECNACGCVDPATNTDDGGNRVCDACAEYTTDNDGETLCSKCEGTETVIVSCGAGNQTLSFLRKSPPEMPEEDPDGEYALYWDTCNARECYVEARFATQGKAEQAMAAKDWPKPGDNTHYLCGWEVRKLVEGIWEPITIETY